jgi:hypothetical protein
MTSATGPAAGGDPLLQVWREALAPAEGEAEADRPRAAIGEAVLAAAERQAVLRRRAAEADGPGEGQAASATAEDKLLQTTVVILDHLPKPTPRLPWWNPLAYGATGVTAGIVMVGCLTTLVVRNVGGPHRSPADVDDAAVVEAKVEQSREIAQATLGSVAPKVVDSAGSGQATARRGAGSAAVATARPAAENAASAPVELAAAAASAPAADKSADPASAPATAAGTRPEPGVARAPAAGASAALDIAAVLPPTKAVSAEAAAPGTTPAARAPAVATAEARAAGALSARAQPPAAPSLAASAAEPRLAAAPPAGAEASRLPAPPAAAAEPSRLAAAPAPTPAASAARAPAAARGTAAARVQLGAGDGPSAGAAADDAAKLQQSLWTAAATGDAPSVRRLADHPAVKVNGTDEQGRSALLLAVTLGDGGPNYQAVVRALLAHDASPNLADRGGTTPLELARRRGQAAVAELLQSAGAR